MDIIGNFTQFNFNKSGLGRILMYEKLGIGFLNIQILIAQMRPRVNEFTEDLEFQKKKRQLEMDRIRNVREALMFRRGNECGFQSLTLSSSCDDIAVVFIWDQCQLTWQKRKSFEERFGSTLRSRILYILMNELEIKINI